MNNLITEKIITAYYKENSKEHLTALEETFFNVYNNHYLFMDWLAYDYFDGSNKTIGEAYYDLNKDNILKEDEEYLLESLNSYLGIYEIDRFENENLVLKDVFTRFNIKVPKDEIDEDIQKYDLLIGRFLRSSNSRLLGRAVISLPCQFKTMLVGHVVEEYERKRRMEAALSYGELFKKYPLLLLKIVGRISSYKNQKADLTVFQSTYAVKDYNKVQEVLKNMEVSIDVDNNQEIYSLYNNGRVLAEIILTKKTLELECKSKGERQKLRANLEANIGQHIIHMKDEDITIDDII